MSSVGNLPADAPELSVAMPPVVPGYRVKRKLGSGGMGSVWLATQVSTGRDVALKVVAYDPQVSEVVQLRFTREFQLAGTLDHPNVARVYDSGSAQGVLFYAMDYVPGLPLDRAIEARQWTTSRAIETFVTICRAVGGAHERGIIHRDLKFSNVLVRDDGVPFVLDFGLALSTHAEQKTATATGQIIGTVGFMPPEQARGDRVGVTTRSDVYALGVMLYKVVTGTMPFGPGVGPTQVLGRMIRGDEVPRPRSIRPDVPRDLEAVIAKATALHPAKRYGNANELADDLERLLHGRRVRAPRITGISRARAALRRHRRVVLASVVVLACLLAGAWAGLLAVRAREAQRHSERLVQWRHYGDALGTAQRLLGQGHTSEALRVLDDLPADRRGWEWRYLRHSVNHPALETTPPAMIREVSFVPGPRLKVLTVDGGTHLVELALLAGDAKRTEIPVGVDATVAADSGIQSIAEEGDSVAVRAQSADGWTSFVLRRGRIGRTGPTLREPQWLHWPGERSPYRTAVVEGGGLCAFADDHRVAVYAARGPAGHFAIPTPSGNPPNRLISDDSGRSALATTVHGEVIWFDLAAHRARVVPLERGIEPVNLSGQELLALESPGTAALRINLDSGAVLPLALPDRAVVLSRSSRWAVLQSDPGLRLVHLPTGTTAPIPALTDLPRFAQGESFMLGIERETGALIYYALSANAPTLQRLANPAGPGEFALALSADDRHAVFWDRNSPTAGYADLTSKSVHSWPTPALVAVATIDRSGTRVALGGRDVRIVESQTGTTLLRLPLPEGSSVRNLEFAPPGNVLLGTQAERLHVWSAGEP